jgi:type II secretory pathway component PulF
MGRLAHIRWPFSKAPKLELRHQIQLLRELAMLLSSGVLIVDALARLKERYPDRRTRLILEDIHSDVAEARSTLSQALGRLPRSFPSSAIALIKAGEEAGTARLADRCTDLADRIAYAHSNRQQVRRACAYPLFVVLMSIGLYILLLTSVFPRVQDLLASLGGQLPPLTRAIMAVAGGTRRFWPAGLLGTGVLILALAVARRIPAAALTIDRRLLLMPVFAPIYSALVVALVSRVYRSLYVANRPAPEILTLCSQVVGNLSYRKQLADAASKISTSRTSLADALGQSGCFPPLACLAIEVGEQSGRLPAALDRIAVFYDGEARRRMELSIAVINPLLTLIVVGGAGLAMLSMFQAIYQVVYAVH